MDIDAIRAEYARAVTEAERFRPGTYGPGAATPARCILWNVPDLHDHMDAWLVDEFKRGVAGDELPSRKLIGEWLASNRRAAA